MLARQWMPRLPFRTVDVLLIDQIGKDISGAGMDTNVVGRKFNDHKAVEDEFPKVKRICLRGLTDADARQRHRASGMAEFCRSQLLRETDFARHAAQRADRPGTSPPPCRRLDYETDREMLDAALGTIGLAEPPDAKLALDRRHAAPGRSRMRRRVSRRSPRSATTWKSSPRRGICRSTRRGICHRRRHMP